MPRLWNQSVARRSIMGHEATHNPSPAASSMLGKKAVRSAKRKLKRGGRKRAYKGNPSPAVVQSIAGLIPGGSLVSGLLGGLGGRFRKPSEVRAAALAPALVQAANAGNLTAAAGLIERAARPMIAKEHAVWVAAAAQLAPSIVASVKIHMKSIPAADQSSPEAFATSVMGSAVQLPAGGGTPAGGLATLLSTAGGARAVGAIARAVTPRRSRRQRYSSYVDRYGTQRYSYKPPGSQMRLPAGATPSADTAYSFFRGSVGQGGAGTTAAQLGVAAAAGTAAYFGTQAILKHFGGRALSAEEGGVAAALAAREARYQYAVAHNLRGAPPSYGVPAAVIRQIGDGMKQKLAELGYNAQGVRTRSGVENFLSDYAPED